MKNLPGFGRINWAILTPKGDRLLYVATNQGVWPVEYESPSSILLLTGDCDHEKAELQLRGWAYYRKKKPCKGRHRYRLYVRPGFALKITDYAPDPARAQIVQRYGDHAHEFLSSECDTPRPRMEVPRSLWAKHLNAAGIRVTRSPLAHRGRLSVQTWDEDHGNLIYNQLTGYVHTPPDCDNNLDDGFYWSDRNSEWQGAAIYDADAFPRTELKLFFAALSPRQRTLISQRLSDGTFHACPTPFYRNGQGFEVIPTGVQITYDRGTRQALDEKEREVFDDAIHYLCTLRPGGTKKQRKQVLACLQEVETGIARQAKTAETIEGHRLVFYGGRKTVADENDGTRLIRLLRLGRMQSLTRGALQRRWRKLAGELTRWESLEVKTLAADFGIGPYPSRQWVAALIRKARADNWARVMHQLQYERQERERAERKAAMLAARRADDTFVITDGVTKDHYYLEVHRDGAVVESHTVCREGTRLFCMKSGCSVQARPTRADLQQIIQKISDEPGAHAWLESHNFQWLFRDLGLVAAA